MITLSQAERLVRKIDELLGRPGMEAQAAKLAQDYAELGRSANRRLEQCAAMIENGEDLQALQLAETQPPLLDLITLLSFRQAKEWREYCQGHNLPFAEPFYDKHVRLLNSTYGKGVASDQSFYRDYRRAVMQGDEKRAFSILRVIARLNPSDKNTAQELRRLEDKAIQEAMEELRQLMAVNDVPAAIAKLTQIEASTLSIPPNHPVWLQAQVVRCQDLLAKAQALRDANSWEETASLVEEIQMLANQNNVPLSASDTQTWNDLEAWTSSCRATLAQEQDCQRALQALQYQLETVENRRPAMNRLSVPQLQADINLLATKLQDVERFGLPLSNELAGQYQTLCTELQDQIQRRQKQKRSATAMGTIAVVALIVIVAAVFLVYAREKDAARQLYAYETSRRVGDTERVLNDAGSFLHHIPSALSGPMESATGLKDAMDKAPQFINREKKLKQDFDQKLQVLHGFARPGAAGSSDESVRAHADCAQLLDQLAPEFKTEAAKQLDDFDKRRQEQVTALQPGYNLDFEKSLASVENYAASHLDLAAGFDALTASFPQLRSQLTDLEKRLGGAIPVEPGLITRFHELTNEFGVWTTATEQVLDAHNSEEYLNGLKLLTESSLLPAAQQGLIGKVLALKQSQSDVLGAVLLPGQPQFWDSLAQSAAAQSLIPDHPTDAEKDVYLKLRDDENIREVYSYHLEKHLRPDNQLENHYVFTHGKLSRNKFGQWNGVVYDPTQYLDHAQFDQHAYDDWDYTNVVFNGILKESRAFQDLQLGDLIDPNTGNYHRPILQLLDQLALDRDSSAMFRAYVSVRLYELAMLRRADWGLLWCPAAAMHIQALKDRGVDNLRSGDWMVSARYARFEKPLEQYFEQAGTNSLGQQALFFQLLARRAYDAGFAFAGFVDGSGKPRVTLANAATLECWGWSQRTYAFTLLLRRADATQEWQKLDGPMPLAPLFVFRGDRRDLLRQVSDAAMYPSQPVKNQLPPLFSGI